MSPELASIIVALITTFGGLSVKAFINMKKQNSADHGKVMKKLDDLTESVDKVSDRLNDHIDWHIKK